eukprot:Nitzschia sp. Nitz4//scaffold322_size40381//3677//4883//NITZ4_007552-RA/size40381-augustus-gene-0.51-mRNA-1//1//CDS//3329547803//7942//frame0
MIGFRDAATTWLILWMANNVGITLLNKASYEIISFPYPYFLSFVHMLCNSIGSQLVFRSYARAKETGRSGYLQQLLGSITRKELDSTGKKYILAFSVIFSLNIAIGNLSLKRVSVNFNQVMRSLVPGITILMGLCLGKKFTTKRMLAVLPVVIGVAMACFGDMTYTALGFATTVACILLAALKVVASGEMLTGSLKLHPVDLLGHMAPLAMVQCIILSVLTGEVNVMLQNQELFTTFAPAAFVVLGGMLSFSLNISSLMANKLTSPLTLCIAANVKQVLMILLATVVFSTPITLLNGCGIAVVLMGSAWYSYVSLLEKQAAKQSSEPGPSAKSSESTERDEETANLIPAPSETGTARKR